MHWDKEIEIPMAGGGRDDGREMDAHREIAELLLRVDEMEDTLQVMDEHPGWRLASGPGGQDARGRLEARLREERARVEALERRGAIHYDAIERAVRRSDAVG